MNVQPLTLQVPKAPLMFVDVEAGREQAYIWLISVLIEGRPDSLRLFYAKTPASEKDILESFLSYREKFDDLEICHYGGFDERLVVRQLATYGLDHDGLGGWYDMQSAVEKSGMLSGGHSSLKEVASRFGYRHRGCDVDGTSAPTTYEEAVCKSDDAATRILREYGEDDVRAMQCILSAVRDDGSIRLDRSWTAAKRTLPPSFEEQCEMIKSLKVDHSMCIKDIMRTLGVSRPYVRSRLRENPGEWKGKDVSFDARGAIRTGILPEADSERVPGWCRGEGAMHGAVVEQVSKNEFRVRVGGTIFQVRKDCLERACSPIHA